MAKKLVTFNGKTIAGPNGAAGMLTTYEMPPCADMTLRFQFSQPGYNPTGVTSKGTWTQVEHPYMNVWDWTCTDTSWATAFGGGGTGKPGKFADYVHNKVMVIDSGDTSTVTNFSRLFQNCYAITSICPIDTSNATDVRIMFSHCENCEKFPDMDFSSATGDGTIAVYQHCYKMITAPNILFPANSSFSLFNFFMGSNNLETVPLYDTTNCTNMANMFSASVSGGKLVSKMKLKSVPFFNTSNVTTMSQMFSGCIELETVPLFNTSNVTTMAMMFSQCNKLSSVPLFDTHNVTDFDKMFNGCTLLTSIPNFNTSNATTMQNMFTGISYDTVGYNDVEMHITNVPNFDYSKVTVFDDFMSNNIGITVIPAMNLNQTITNVSNMFMNSLNVQAGIKTLYDTLSQIQTITDYTDAFKNCGIDTLEGHYQLSQIPTSWGGLLDPDHTVTIGGRTYRTVTIGNQEWMAENLELDVQGSTWYNNDSSYKDKGYGKLYTREQALSVSLPDGWRLPTHSDFRQLSNTVVDIKKLMSKIEWDVIGTDDYGFFMIPTDINANKKIAEFIADEADEIILFMDGGIIYLQTAASCSVRFVKDLT